MEFIINDISYDIDSYSINVTKKEKKITFTVKTDDETVFSATKDLLKVKPLTIKNELGLFNIHDTKVSTEEISDTSNPDSKSYKIKVIAIC